MKTLIATLATLLFVSCSQRPRELTADEKAYVAKIDERVVALKFVREEKAKFLANQYREVTNAGPDHFDNRLWESAQFYLNSIDAADREIFELELRKIEFRLNRSNHH